MSEHIESVYTNGQMTIDQIKEYRENWMRAFSGIMHGCRIVILYKENETFNKVCEELDRGEELDRAQL